MKSVKSIAGTVLCAVLRGLQRTHFKILKQWFMSLEMHCIKLPELISTFKL